MLLGVGRTQLPPAWRTGQAEPWPSAQEGAARRREAEERQQGIEPQARARARAQARAAAARPHPSSKKRKRKRRD